MSIEGLTGDLRRAMRNFATGVCIATTYADGVDGRRHDAVTINSGERKTT